MLSFLLGPYKSPTASQLATSQANLEASTQKTLQLLKRQTSTCCGTTPSWCRIHVYYIKNTGQIKCKDICRGCLQYDADHRKSFPNCSGSNRRLAILRKECFRKTKPSQGKVRMYPLSLAKDCRPWLISCRLRPIQIVVSRIDMDTNTRTPAPDVSSKPSRRVRQKSSSAISHVTRELQQTVDRLVNLPQRSLAWIGGEMDPPALGETLPI
jgi:hypothetical protein